MSRWYDQHRVERRIRRVEQLQLRGALLLERVGERVVRSESGRLSETQGGLGGATYPLASPLGSSEA